MNTKDTQNKTTNDSFDSQDDLDWLELDSEDMVSDEDAAFGSEEGPDEREQEAFVPSKKNKKIQNKQKKSKSTFVIVLFLLLSLGLGYMVFLGQKTNESGASLDSTPIVSIDSDVIPPPADQSPASVADQNIQNPTGPEIALGVSEISGQNPSPSSDENQKSVLEGSIDSGLGAEQPKVDSDGALTPLPDLSTLEIADLAVLDDELVPPPQTEAMLVDSNATLEQLKTMPEQHDSIQPDSVELAPQDQSLPLSQTSTANVVVDKPLAGGSQAGQAEMLSNGTSEAVEMPPKAPAASMVLEHQDKTPAPEQVIPENPPKVGSNPAPIGDQGSVAQASSPSSADKVNAPSADKISTPISDAAVSKQADKSAGTSVPEVKTPVSSAPADQNVALKKASQKPQNPETSKSLSASSSKEVEVKKKLTKNTPAPNWQLRSAQPKGAVIYDPNTGNMQTVEVGDYVEGIGQVRSISIANQKWVVRGSLGKISQ